MSMVGILIHQQRIDTSEILGDFRSDFFLGMIRYSSTWDISFLTNGSTVLTISHFTHCLRDHRNSKTLIALQTKRYCAWSRNPAPVDNVSNIQLQILFGFQPPKRSGWWFGCHFLFSMNIGNVIIPIDFHIFQRGGPTTNHPKDLLLVDRISQPSTVWKDRCLDCSQSLPDLEAGHPRWSQARPQMFGKKWVPNHGWFIRENPMKMDDLWIPPFMETLYVYFANGIWGRVIDIYYSI